jgi:hypothetical protein
MPAVRLRGDILVEYHELWGAPHICLPEFSDVTIQGDLDGSVSHDYFVLTLLKKIWPRVRDWTLPGHNGMSAEGRDGPHD